MSIAESNAWSKGFTAGYACAVANILRTHDDERIARDVLAGMPVAKDEVALEDYEILKAQGLIEPPVDSQPG